MKTKTVFVCQVESETAESELKVSNTTSRLLHLEREIGLLRQNDLEMKQLADSANRITGQAKQDADEAQQVSRNTSLRLRMNHGSFSTAAAA